MTNSKNLLQQIEEEAVDSKSDVASLLRKCQVLAFRLHNDSLKGWIHNELNGYSDRLEIPEYRVFPCQAIGTFYGMGTKMKNAPIPQMCVPEDIREDLFTLRFYQGVGSLQELLTKDNGTLTIPWPGDLVALLSQNVYQGMGMLDAHMEFSPDSIVKILETVRNRILDFVLALEEDCPNAGDAIGAAKMDKKRIDQMVTNNIFKGVGNVALHCGAVTQNNTVNVEKGNWALLEGLLKGLKIANEEIAELKEILENEKPKKEAKFGDRLSAWLGNLTAKAAQGVYDISTGTVSGVIAAAICKYYGWV